jgi:hypothetical protein
MTTDVIDRLDDATVLRILSEVTADLAEVMPDKPTTGIKTFDDANGAVKSLLNMDGGQMVVVSDETAARSARALLKVLATDEQTRGRVLALVEHPPADAQRSLEAAAAAAVVLGAIITWLQTRIEITVDRKGKDTQFHFALRKNETNPSVLKSVVDTVRNIL